MGAGVCKKRLRQENKARMPVEAMAVAASVQRAGATKRQFYPIAPGFLKPERVHTITALGQDQCAQGIAIAFGQKHMGEKYVVGIAGDRDLAGVLPGYPSLGQDQRARLRDAGRDKQ